MPTRNLRDILAERVNAAKQGVAEALAKRLGPPPSTVAGRAQKDDEYRLWWKPAPGWEDPATAQQQAAAMYAQGAKPHQVTMAMYPDRVKLLVLGDRRDNLGAQVKFAEEMAQQRVEKGAAVLDEAMKVIEQEGSDEHR